MNGKPDCPAGAHHIELNGLGETYRIKLHLLHGPYPENP